MAIGSNPEVGTVFKLCRHYTAEDWQAWWEYMRTNWHPNLHEGWASIIHNKENNPLYGRLPQSTP